MYAFQTNPRTKKAAATALKTHSHKIGFYIRVSTEEQAENPEGSIRNQEERLKTAVKLRNLDGNFGEIAGVYVDRGKSGKDTNRSELQRLLADIQQGSISLVMVSDLSRLSRSIRDFCEMWEMMKACGCSFQSLRENVDTTTAAGEMVLFTLANLAQFERAQTAERVAADMQARAARGLFNGGRVPLGYRLVEGKAGYLEIDPEGAETVKAAFRALIREGSLAPAAKWLNSNGFRSCRESQGGGSKPRMGHFNVQNLGDTFRNRSYLGLRVHQVRGERRETKAVWEPIIDQATYDRVQEILKRNLQHYKPETFKTYPFILSGMVRCGECGGNLCGKSANGNGGKIPYYEHGWLTKRNGCLLKKGYTCKRFRVGAKKLEPVIMQKLEELLIEPATAVEIIRLAKIQHKTDGRKRDFQRAKTRAGELEGQLEVLAERLASLPKAISPAAIYKQMEKLQTMKAEADNRLAELRQRADEGQGPASIERYQELLELARSIKEAPNSGGNARVASKLVRALIERIEILPEGYRVHFKVGEHDVTRGLTQVGSLASRMKKAAESAAFRNLIGGAPRRGSMVRELLTKPSRRGCITTPAPHRT